MKENPLLKVRELGQGVWLDFLSRDLLDSGEIVRLIREDGLSGITSNPATFQKALAESAAYEEDIKRLARAGKGTAEIYEALAVADIQLAADFLRPLHGRLHGRDGFVSLEVSPYLAHDTVGTIQEARRLWQKVGRPNVLIKVPGTWEGVAAFRELIAGEVNVNVTLLFGLQRYRAIAEAYLDGIEERVAQGLSVDKVSSVASFFLSRIDVLVDGMLDKIAAVGGPEGEKAQGLKGLAATACAKIAYTIYQEIVSTERFQRFTALGCRPQRVLWASTGRKNPAYSDIKYVEPLIGPETVNTMPLDTIVAYRDHGSPESRLEDGVQEAHATLDRLQELGIDMTRVAQELEDDGVAKFIAPYDLMMKTLDQKRLAALG